MNDRYDGYDQRDDRYELVGYDEFGQPVYRQVQQAPSYDQTAAGPGYGYGYDPYATGQQQPVPPAAPQQYDPYGAAGHDPYGQATGTGEQPRVPQQTHPGQQDPQAYQAPQTYQEPQTYPAHQGPQGYPEQEAPRAHRAATQPPHQTEQATAYIPQQAPRGPEREQPPGGEDRDYRTEQFSFVEEPDENSEDVIDWLKFTESRSERREEARRRGRNRVVALVVALAVCLVGGVGYLWYADKLPFLSGDGAKSGGAAAAGPQNRDVIVVHLHNTKGGGTSSALLVNNTTTKQGSTVLLPNSLALSGDDGTATTLGASVDDDGSSGTSGAIDTLLGTDVEGTWRLDTPYLNNLVELVGNIELDTDADVPDPAKKGTTLVHKGAAQTLSGPMAVAYATYRAKGEGETAQLMRFGQVMQGVLRKLSSDPQAATTTVQTLAQILDPSLTEKDLGAFLAKLADHAKEGDYKTALLPVQQNGTLSETAADSVVKDVLGGTVKAPAKGDSLRIAVTNATGDKARTEKARVALVNGGYTFVAGGTGSSVAASLVTYGDDARKEDAVEVAKTLGLPSSAVKKTKAAANADVSVVLGQDYTGT
ncbi:LytR C-terminal domain-containing protein [Streptomyces sp. NPDC049813]|uniref:LCP family protein n=1 Tax=Streptomyces sp. NPDC049813 TaxID=3365597 RepID=UPI0037A7FFB5